MGRFSFGWARYPLLGCLCFASTLLYAEAVVTAGGQPVHDFSVNRPLLSETDIPPRPSALGSLPTAVQLSKSPDEWRNNPDLFGRVLDKAIRTKRLDILSRLLPEYEAMPEHDEALALYARAVLAYGQQQHTDAVSALRRLLQHKPALHYVRMDLARILAEDRQYAEARQEWQYVAAHTDGTLAQAAQNYIQQMDDILSTRWNISGNYTRNDNINQASDVRELYIGNIRFMKSENSLPKTGHGITYQFDADRLLPVSGHHYAGISLSYGGTEYWDEREYSESTLRFSPSYVYQRYGLRFQAAPFYERNWLGGETYGSNTGVQLSFSKNLGRHWLMPYVLAARKSYDEPRLRAYEGRRYQSGLTWAYQPSPQTSVSLGADYAYESLNSRRETSHTAAVRAGAVYQWQNGLGVQTNMRLARRWFAADFPLFGVTRSDRDFSGSLALWHNRISYQGITPRLVYRYRSIKSNIPALYSWTTKGLNLEVHKTF